MEDIINKKNRQQWDTNGYFVCRNLFSDKLIDILRNYYQLFSESHKFKTCPISGESTLQARRFVIFESILDVFSLYLNEQLDSQYLPTLSNVRESHLTSSFPAHTDRSACEVTCSFPLFVEKSHPWPLYLAKEANAKGTPIYLNIGDLVVFKGHEIFHWREPYSGSRQVQVQMHYVQQGGKFEKYRYDEQGELAVDMQKLKLIKPKQARDKISYANMISKLQSILDTNLQSMNHQFI
ncbi:hypothetical protein [Aliiglaciecola sp. LCG003]|uniref:hypothetical protein n=1 Tax=Aliiglaciecola sp. LCG003 TaxID=3053655 RepID=UPI00257224B4|nr:hypothetical protein [Aliiglaciecola sp. LCG003]WJG11180.1 hypothetical protein QR722_09170 [Aliiglaciecola sp. LCG003]